MKRRITLGGAVTLALMFSTVTFVITMLWSMNVFNGSVYNIKERETMYAKLAEVDGIARQNYLYGIDEDRLSDSLIEGYIAGLGDEYGRYFTAEQYNSLMKNYDGQMVDIGLVCGPNPDGYIRIDQVYPDSPALEAGLAKDDLIVKVDELSVTGENYADAVEALRGDPGTTVELLVRREGVEKTYTITRRRVEVPSVEYRMIDNVGYLRIKEFNNNTPDQFNRGLDRLMQEGAEALVFDVRSNPGGPIESVAAMLDRLLPEGPIVSATYKDGRTEVLYTSDAEEITLPMVVLINQSSASAAELFAQALKDYGKCRTVGVTSYGKGVMQNIQRLSDGSALDITVAYYNPPKSANFDGVGIKPDYEVKLNAEQEKELWDLDETNDPQFRKALELVGAAIRNLDPSTDINGEFEATIVDETGESASSSEGESEPGGEGSASSQDGEEEASGDGSSSDSDSSSDAESGEDDGASGS